MTYEKQTWVDGPGGGTPLSATRLTHIEEGIYDSYLTDWLGQTVDPGFEPGFVSLPTFFDPVSATWEEAGWWMVEWQHYIPQVNLLLGVYDLNDHDDSAWIQLIADSDAAYMSAAQYNKSGEAAMLCNVNGAQIRVRTVIGQADDQHAFYTALSDGTPAFKIGPTGALEFLEQATPAAPAENNCRIYAKDVGGKTGLYVLFPTGAEQQIKVEA